MSFRSRGELLSSFLSSLLDFYCFILSRLCCVCLDVSFEARVARSDSFCIFVGVIFNEV